MFLRIVLMARKHWGALSLAAVGIVGAALLNLVTPEVARRLVAWLDRADKGGAAFDSADPGPQIAVYVVALIGAYLVRAACRFLSIAVAHIAAWRFVPDLMLTLYNKLQSLSLKFYHSRQSGEILSRVVNDSRQFETLIAHALPDLASNLLVVLGVAVMLFTINPRLAALTMIPAPFVVLASLLFSKKVRPLFMINQRVLGSLTGAIQDNLSGMKEIQAFAQEKTEGEKMGARTKEYSKVNINANIASGLYHPFVEFLTSLGTVIVVGWGGMMALRGELPLADVVGFMMYLGLFYSPLATLARLVEDAQNTYAGGVRVFELLDAESDVKEAPGAKAIKNCRGEIVFDRVSFRYAEEGGEENIVLDDVSFAVEPGRTVAVVGPTGVGKTTILSLLERFYDPQKGRILLDGQDIRGLKLESLRSQVSMVLQDTFLFNGSVAENIAYGSPGATLDDVRRAAKAAFADEFIMATPSGYDTIVGERGVRLSGGQKQRVAIARAILRPSPILALDEATSAVDVETEREIQKAVDALSGQRTIIVIAHRLSTVRRADTIIVLDKGRVAEQGNHDELIAKGGLYAKMAELQSRGRR